MRVLQKPEVGEPGWVKPTRVAAPSFLSQKEPTPPDPLASERAALEQQKRELEATIRRYQQSIAAIEDSKQATDARTMSDLTELAFSVGRELALRELQNDPTPVAELIKKLAAEMATEARLVVRVSPHDYSALTAADALSTPETRHLEIIADPGLEPGSCELTGPKTNVSSTFNQRERAVRRELALTDEPYAPQLLKAAEHGRALQ
ncbi:MAG: hypothetical protein IT381_32615 [Deltaproteobacteria bacterium]|nr:hypothetical protein [Deltaproteobacteria bacterium]